MDVKGFTEKLRTMKESGYIESKRRGNTGIGYTLETLLGIEENNLKAPDLYFEEGNRMVELKSQRRHATNKVTLFTFNRGVWNVPQSEVVKRYGYQDSGGRMALYSTVTSQVNNQGLYLNTADDLQLKHLDGTVVAEWSREGLIRTFTEKIPALVIVIADCRTNAADKEEFHFNEAHILSQPSNHNFMELIKTDRIVVDIRMHLRDNGTPRNHGTGFRIEERFLNLCFAQKDRLV